MSSEDTKISAYAHPERLVTTDWLAEQVSAGGIGGPDGIALLESDEDVLLYETGHIPGALKIDWHVDLNDPITRDYVDGARFAEVMGARGIGRDTTVVIYGDKSNWWAAYALWVFSLFGHEDVRLLDGGRAKWIAEGRELTRDVPSTTRWPSATTPRSAPSRTTSWPTSASRSSTSAPPASTPASCSTCPTTPRRGRCAAATSPG